MRDNQLIYPTMVNTTRMLTKFMQFRNLPKTHLYIRKPYSPEIPITVQFKGQSGELDHCNHAGALLDVVPSDTSDNPHNVVVRVCKCGSVENKIGVWS